MSEPVLGGQARASLGKRLQLADRLGRLTAIGLVVLGVTGLLGYALGARLLLAPVRGWPDVPLLSCVAMLALALAIWSLARGKRWPALVASAVTLALCTTALIFFATSLRLPAGGLSVASALLLGAGSLALYVAAVERRADVVQLTMGISGFMLLALAITVLFARFVGVTASGAGAVVAGASLQALAGGLLLGVTFVANVWARGFTIVEPPGWLPFAAGTASLLTVLFLWRALESREQSLVRNATQQAADAERRAILRELDMTARSVRRGAEWAASGVSAQEQQRDLRALVRDLGPIDVGVRIDAQGSPSISVPEGTEFTAVAVAEAWRRHNRGAVYPTDTVAYLPLEDSRTEFAIVAPVCDSATCSGAMAGVVRLEELFRKSVTDSSGGYRFNIAELSGEAAATPTQWVARVPISIGAMRWTLRAAPADIGVGGATTRSNLPAAVLFMGLVVTALLPVTLRLGRAAWRSARAAERGRLSVALERATDGIWEWDLVSGFASRSAGLWAHLKYDPARVNPDLEAWTSLIHPEDRERVESELGSHIAGRTESFEAEYRVRSGEGDWHIIVDRGRVVDRSAGGTPTRMLGISADVTEGRASVAAREASERRFRAIFDSGFQFQILMDCEGRILEVNKVTLDRAGVTLDEVSGRFGWETLWWRNNPDARRLLEEACQRAGQGTPKVYEQEITDLDGQAAILEISVRPIMGPDGKAVQLVVEARDITARRRAAAALQEVDTLTAMGRIAARVAHEINNPLAGIQNSFLLIKDAVPLDHPHHKYVGAIEREISRIARVTRQLYETYRPEQDLGGEASVHMVVGDAVAFLEQVNRGARLRIETDLRGVPSVVPLPAAMLRQIIYNLVQNAADASSQGAAIQVHAVLNGDELRISVSDQGPGVPEELRERIFEPFFSTKDKRMRTGGMGLGLALVRRTVIAAQGRIEVDDAEGGGARFTVILPLDKGREGVRA